MSYENDHHCRKRLTRWFGALFNDLMDIFFISRGKDFFTRIVFAAACFYLSFLCNRYRQRQNGCKVECYNRLNMPWRKNSNLLSYFMFYCAEEKYAFNKHLDQNIVIYISLISYKIYYIELIFLIFSIIEANLDRKCYSKPSTFI